mgnify:CR=1 FL=1|tara:strand:- start:6350 stop:6646 length:297 start_codon:yes stop_codon:yes gene_type:complete
MEERLGGKQYDEAKRNELAEHFGDDLLFADNFDNAIIGVSMGISCGTKVVYNAEEMARTLVVSEGITKEEAWEYLEFNTFCAYVGDNTPIFVSTSLDV